MFRFAVAALAFSASMASAQGACIAKSEMRKVLSEKHGEIPYGIGLSDGALYEMWANPRTGSWTIVRTIPAGVSCIVASGGNFDTSKEARAFLGQRL